MEINTLLSQSPDCSRLLLALASFINFLLRPAVYRPSDLALLRMQIHSRAGAIQFYGVSTRRRAIATR